MRSGGEGGGESGTPTIASAPPTRGASGVLGIGMPAVVFTPDDGRAEPTYYIWPVSETHIEESGGVRVEHLEVHPGPEFLRVAPSLVRGMNPNVFIRRDDPFAWMAEVLP